MGFTSSVKKYIELNNGYYRFIFGLRNFLKETITLEDAKATIQYRLEHREENFLRLVEKGVYGYERSPYLKLLKTANYSFSDVKDLVDSEGLEGALETLRREGVYVSYEESKGKKPIIRKGKMFEVKDADFHNPYISTYYEGRSGGSRSPGTIIQMNFDFLSQIAAYDILIDEIYGLQGTPRGVWLHVLPVLSGISRILRDAKIGCPTEKWFTPLDTRSNLASPMDRLIHNTLFYEGKLLGHKFPKCEFVNLNEAFKIAKWINLTLKEFGACVFVTSPSLAVRICKEAEKKGLELDGATIKMGGEPITKAKQRVIKSVGAEIIPHYVMSECGTLGCACKTREAVDEVHFFKDSLALIHFKRYIEFPEKEVDNMFLTSLIPSAPKILLNFESDDFGVTGERNCGCPFQEVGFPDHIHTIRSFSKLTGEGVTFLGTDLVKVLEEDLPKLYGGGPTDYQLLEKEEGSSGMTCLILNVSPDVGEINEEDLKEKFLDLINPTGKDPNIDMWEKGGSIIVKRGYPIQTKSGKIMPFHITH